MGCDASWNKRIFFGHSMIVKTVVKNTQGWLQGGGGGEEGGRIFGEKVWTTCGKEDHISVL